MREWMEVCSSCTAVVATLKPAEASTHPHYLNATFGVNLCGYSFPAAAMAALAAGWTRDPFDRLIAAHAKANGEAMPITADTAIRKHYPRAIW
jgi:hypothetical protein